MPDKVLGLFKFGERAHIEELVTEGHLFMNPLSCFISMESDELRGDGNEALRYTWPAEGAELEIKSGDQWTKVATLTGPIRFRDPELEQANVFCMYAFRERHAHILIDPRICNFGDTFVLFADGDEFLRRVRLAAQRDKLQIKEGLVEYVEPSVYNGRMGVFKKYAPFDFQSEFRLALLPGTGKPYSLRVGDLSDIAIIGDSAQVNSRIRVVNA